MKKTLALLLTIACLLSACAFAETAAEPTFIDYACSYMESICQMMVEIAGVERPYTSATEIPGFGAIFSNDDNTLTAILYPNETDDGVSGGTIYTDSPEHVRNAMHTLCMLSLLDASGYQDGIAVADWFDRNYDSVIELYYNPVTPQPEDPNDAMHSLSFTGDYGLEVTMDTYSVDSTFLFTITFQVGSAD